MLFLHKMLAIGQAFAILRAQRYAPDLAKDQQEFDQKWAGRDCLTTPLERDNPRFKHGGLPHQVALAASIDFQLTNARNNLSAIANEANGYLNSYTILLAVVTVLVGTGKLGDVWWLVKLLVWPAALILALLWYVHASPLGSWKEKVKGAGEKAACTDYANTNDARLMVIKFKVRINRSERILSVVPLLFTLCLVVLCVAVSVQFL